MHDNLIKDIEKLIEDIVIYYGCYLVGVVFVPARRDSGVILRVYVDAEGGVNISQLSDISKELSMILDVKDLIKFKYTLEVSSPGINRIIVKFSDYEKYKGKKVKISLRKKIDGRVNLIGKIIDVENSEPDKNPSIKIFDEIENKTQIVPFIQIKKGNLLIV
ncbi:MAG: ribosome maturation factor RimP [Deltaproteobacteria bacterium]|nr:ribosome maturation factor RimP [Deltaproteobacteria bacterium]